LRSNPTYAHRQRKIQKHFKGSTHKKEQAKKTEAGEADNRRLDSAEEEDEEDGQEGQKLTRRERRELLLSWNCTQVLLLLLTVTTFPDDSKEI
jgi:hypothetical protein